MGLDMHLIDKDHNEICYWRKANQIHRWFVEHVQDNVDDCNSYYVKKKDIEELLSTCRAVVLSCNLIDGYVQNGYTYENKKRKPIFEEGKVVENPTVAKKLLPTFTGFFFGHYDYDEYYVSDLNYTIDKLEHILKTFDFKNNRLFYQSWW